MNKRLFVGGIPFSSTADELQKMFSAAGTVVSCTIVTDKFSGRSKGFGFIEMATEEEAKKAVEMFNQQSMAGRTITVNEARPMEARDDSRRDSRGPRRSQ